MPGFPKNVGRGIPCCPSCVSVCCSCPPTITLSISGVEVCPDVEVDELPNGIWELPLDEYHSSPENRSCVYVGTMGGMVAFVYISRAGVGDTGDIVTFIQVQTDGLDGVFLFTFFPGVDDPDEGGLPVGSPIPSDRPACNIAGPTHGGEAIVTIPSDTEPEE